jgi:hypothetical protein
MAESIQEKVRRSIEVSKTLYYRLVLVVGGSGSGKTDLLSHIAAEFNASVININLTLSSDLLDLTAKERILRLPDLFYQITGKNNSPVFLDNLEILFDKDLKQDPLRLMQGLSRNRTVVASWNGSVKSGVLQYAEMGHPEYRSHKIVDTLIVGMNGWSTIG